MQLRLKRHSPARLLLSACLLALACCSDRASSADDAFIDDALIEDALIEDDALDAGAPDASPLTEWSAVTFRIFRRPFSGLVYQSHVQDGDIVIRVERDGALWVLPWNDCAGQHALFVGQLPADRLAELSARLTATVAPQVTTDTICFCADCGREQIDIELPDMAIHLAAQPAFEPLMHCTFGQEVRTPFSPAIVALGESLRDTVLALQADEIAVSPTAPTAVWLNVIAPGEWSYALPDPVVWSIDEIALADVLDPDARYGMERHRVEGALATRVLEFCATAQSGWPADTDACNQALFVVARQGDHDFIVSCQPAIL